VKGIVFHKGAPATLHYQFHNFRVTGNYLISRGAASTIKLGGSIIARYLNFDVQSQGVSGRNINFIAFPILNFDWEWALDSSKSLHFRIDTFPTLNGIDGLYDALLALKLGKELFWNEIGIRAFWGGYSPDEATENNNRIAFIGPVVRVRF